MTEIGPFSIVETLATRAFTVTYRAEQRSVGRTVLVKTLKPTVSAESPYAADLEREAAVLGRLDHEAIPRLYDLVRTRETVYLVTEDLRGATLADVLGAARLAIEPAAAIAIALARGVGHAHAHGVVIRGLRPAIVLLTAAGGVKIADLSAAEARDLPPSATPEPLEAGETFARPDYMAPEQILGEGATARADVWALGVLLHELLAGARPFDAADRRAIAQRIRGGAPEPLPAEVPRSLARVVSRCLAKAPEDRYTDAQEVALAIEEALAERSRVPVAVLVTRALAAAKLGEALPLPPGAGAPPPRIGGSGPRVRRAARSLAVVFALIAAGGAAIELMRDPETAGDLGAAAGEKGTGLLRVVAKPWAEVFLDGDYVDVTPIGRAIPVTPGTHFVTFRHPKAPDEQRSIKIAAGQTVFLDVTMRVEHDAGAPDARRDAAESP